jgi:hypothetical protein
VAKRLFGFLSLKQPYPMNQRFLHNFKVVHYQESRLPVEVKCRQRLFPFENVKPPAPFRLPRFRGLAVLDDDAVEGVGVLQQFAGNFKIWRLFWDLSLFCRVFRLDSERDKQINTKVSDLKNHVKLHS